MVTLSHVVGELLVQLPVFYTSLFDLICSNLATSFMHDNALVHIAGVVKILLMN